MALATACITDLNTELGEYIWVGAINDRGVMVGKTTAPTWEPVRFDPGGARFPLGGTNGDQTYIHDINNANDVLGTVWFESEHGRSSYPVVWKESGELIDLREFVPHAGQPGVWMQGKEINNEGLVVGQMRGYDYATGTPTEGIFAVNVRTRTVYDIPPEIGGTYNVVKGVNDHGVMVGQSDLGPSARWIPQGDRYVRELLVEYFSALDINNAGDIAGYYGYPSPGQVAIWKPGAGAPDKLTSPTLTSRHTPTDVRITENGVVVAKWYDNDSSRPTRLDTVARWKANDPNPVPEVFPTDAWTDFEIQDVNNNGAVVGEATRSSDGDRRTIRWTMDG